MLQVCIYIVIIIGIIIIHVITLIFIHSFPDKETEALSSSENCLRLHS